MTPKYRKGDKVAVWCHNNKGVSYLNSHATVVAVRKGWAYVVSETYTMWIEIDKGRDWPICIEPEVTD